MRTDFPLRAGTFFTERVKSSLKGTAWSRRWSISSRSSPAMSSKSLRGMGRVEVVVVMENGEDEDDQRDHGDEAGVVAGTHFFQGNEEGDEQPGEGAAEGIGLGLDPCVVLD